MARADYIETAKQKLYGPGMGEKPSIRQVAADANETINTETIVFDLAAGDGASVKPGHVLSSNDAATVALSYSLYVLSVATDTITATRSYHGSPDAGASADLLDGLLLEHNAQTPEYELQGFLDTIINTLLYPTAYIFDTGSIVSPDVSFGSNEVPANIKKIDSVWQIVAGREFSLAYGLRKNLHTTVSSSGSLLFVDVFDASTVYYSFIRKIIVGDEAADPDELVTMVATGMAALAMGASMAETEMEKGKKDSQSRQPIQVASNLWRDFLTFRQNYGDEDSEDFTEIIVERSL